MQPVRIPEEFLHFLWRTRRFEQAELRTTHGEAIEIIDQGRYNEHAGPDFLLARIKIGDQQWAGQVELHVKASDWLAHKHAHDPAYQNVILHVVWEEDRPIYLADGSRLPCLELKNRTPTHLFARYRQLQQSRLKVPCTSRLAEVSALVRNAWLDRMLAERLEQKAEQLKILWEDAHFDWEQTLRISIARAMGLPANADALQELMRHLPHTLVARYRSVCEHVEALFFGQAGLLEGHFKDAWPRMLQREYRFLAKKHGLSPMSAACWKWSRMRPPSFPSLRIAQLATLSQKYSQWFSAFRQMESVSEVAAFFDCKPSAYWSKHHHWQRPSARDFSRPGKSLVQRVVVNALAPFFFFYGGQTKELNYKEQALNWLSQLPPESNQVVRRWRDFGWRIDSAEHSQAVIHLERAYCERRKCLDCAIGHVLLKR